MKKAVCVIIEQEGKILGVSRKDDHNDFGLVGGKVEDSDPDIEFAIIRETKEETGIDIFNLELLDTREWGGYIQNCFKAEHRGYINYDMDKEPHIVKWIDPKDILNGSFGEYNEMIFRKLNII